MMREKNRPFISKRKNTDMESPRAQGQETKKHIAIDNPARKQHSFWHFVLFFVF